MLNQNIFSGTAFSMQIQLDLVDFLTESGGLNFASLFRAYPAVWELSKKIM